MKTRISYIILYALTLFVTIQVRAQQQQNANERIAALKRQLTGHADDSGKVEILNEIAYTYNKISPYDGIRYAERSLLLATELKWKRGMARANSCIGANYYSLSDYPKAHEYWIKALALNEELGNKTGIANHLHNIGNIYFSQKIYADALGYYERALAAYNEIGDKKLSTHTLSMIGNVYTQLKDYPKSLQYHFMALAIDEELGKKTDISSDMMDIGSVYSEQGNYTKALEALLNAVKIKKETGDKNGLAKTYNLAGNTYLNIAKYIAAGKGITNVYGSVKDNLGNAKSYLDSAVAISKEIGYLDNLQKSYAGLAEVYKIAGDYKMAMDYSDNFHAIRDSVFSQENNANIVKQGMKFENEKVRMADKLESTVKLQRQRTYTYIGLAGVVLLLCFSFFIIKERRKSDHLLSNIIPADVMSELKSKGAVKARQFDNVTVLFTDFVNFTKASEAMSPTELINELHTCFKAFDEIMTKYGIEKIKTIGDAYLAVSGLPVPNSDHAEHMVRAALEVNAFIVNRRAQMGGNAFAMRVGMHSGSVVAGVVGVRKFAYDIWGDTVNTAARMEQSGDAGRVNISQSTYELVKDKFTCIYRGEVEAKNKGKMQMYFVAVKQ